MEVASEEPTHSGQGLPDPPCSPAVQMPEAKKARDLIQKRYDSGCLHAGIEELIIKIGLIEKERDLARGIAVYYRNRSSDTQDEADEHALPWENDQIQPANQEPKEL